MSGVDAKRVTAGKPKIGGAVYNAPLGTALPTDATTALPEAWESVGYISEDGVTNANSASSETIKAWGGDSVMSTQTEKTDTFGFKMIEGLNPTVLKVVYNRSNVSGESLETGITVRANSDEAEASSWVFDTILNGGVLKRLVVPNAKISEMEEIVYKDNEPIGYGVTLNAMPGDEDFDYDTHKEYIIKPSTAGSGENGNG